MFLYYNACLQSDIYVCIQSSFDLLDDYESGHEEDPVTDFHKV